MDLRLIAKVLKLSFFTAVFLVAKPQRLGHQFIVKLKTPVSVSLKKNTPPFVAFEEVQGVSYAKKSEYDVLDQVPSSFQIPKDAKTDLINSQEPQVRHIQLATMTIRKQVETVQTPITIRDDSENFARATSTVAARNYASTATAEDDYSDLPASLQTRLKLAQARSGVLNQDWSMPNQQDEIREIIASELQKQNNGAQIILSTTTVSNPAASATGNSGNSQQNADSSNPPPANEIQVVGKFEVVGIGVTNEHHIELRRIEQGIVKEAGRVIVSDGFYSINVASLSGELVGRVVHNSGRLEGEKRVRLVQVGLAKRGLAYVGPNLLVGTSSGADIASLATPYGGPSKSEASRKTVASILYGTKTVETKSKVKAEFQDLHAGSSTILKTTRERYVPTLSLITVGNSIETPLFNDGTLSGLRALLNDQMGIHVSEEQPLIWGRVMFDGHAMSGVKVKTVQNYGGQAIYLNEFMLPDKNLTATADSGYFVIPVEQEGFFSLIAEKDEHIFGFVNTLAESGSVAYAQVEDSIQKQPMVLRSFDAFSGQPVSSQISLQSSDMIYELADGEESVIVSVVSRHALAQSRGNAEYMDSTYVYEEAKGYAHFPMVKKSWYQQLLSDNRININPGSGAIIGFSPDENFEVFLPSLGESPMEIIYFNNRGEILPQKETGVAGGGFMIVNLPESVHEVSVFLSTSQKLISKVSPIYANDVITHLFTIN